MKLKLYIFIAIILLSGIQPDKSLAIKHIVHVGSFYFSPNTLNVNVGDTIRWVWDNGSHTTTSATLPAGAPTWDSPINSASQSFEYKVVVAGVHNYVCTPHASMGHIGSFTATGAAPTLSVTPSNRNVTAMMGSTTFSVSSNSNWSVTSSANWCSVTTSGNGNGTIFADYLENTSLAPRVASISITVNGLPTQTVTVSQAGAAATLSVTPANQQVNAQAGNTQFDISSNATWNASSDASWCSVTPSGTGNGQLNAVYEENLLNQPRAATITISAAGAPTQIVTVSQDGSTVGLADKDGFALKVSTRLIGNTFSVLTNLPSGKSFSINILDIHGKTLIRRMGGGTEEISIDLTTLPSGIYLAKVETSNEKPCIRKFNLVK
jgi:plastocyanin